MRGFSSTSYSLIARSDLSIALVYLAAGVLAYASTFDIFFMSDDFDFLGIVAPAESPLVMFEPLVGRFVRPLVVLMYYANYHTIGLAPWGYHVSTLAAHLVSSWLVYRIAFRVGGERLWAFLAGLLFVVFGSHSEAVTWPAGIADPILTVFLLLAFLFYLRAIEPGTPAAWLVAMFGAILIATQAKELWVVFPALLVVHAVTMGVPAGVPRTRALVAIGACAVLVLGYLAMRHLVFGSVTGGYSGLGSSLQPGLWHRQARAFILRSFAPPTPLWASPILRGWDIAGWLAAFAVLAMAARGRMRRLLLFSGASILVALLPVLPLTISVVSTESERFTYLPSAFSCMFIVWAIHAVVRIRPAAVAVCAVVIALHAVALAGSNRVWQASGALTRRIVLSFAAQTQAHDPGGTAAVFILNLPDNVLGAYVFRNGFYNAVRLVTPEAAGRTAQTFGLATQSMGGLEDEARVERIGSRGFRIDLGANRVIQPQIPSAVQFRIVGQTPTSYEVEFSESVDKALVLYLTRGRLEVAGTVEGPGAPFGHVDIPADAALCDGESIRFAGWALDNEAVARVTLSAIDPDDAAPGAGTILGEAVWRPGDRPDVAQTFGAYPNADRASWDFHLPCATVGREPRGMIRVRVMAQDNGGREAVLGERMVRASR